MYTKSITYTDFNGMKRTEDFRFNLNSDEITKLELDGTKGSLSERLDALSKSPDPGKIFEVLRTLIRLSYGEKSVDGRRFIKSKIVDGYRVQLADEFEETNAFVELYSQLLNDNKELIAFINGIMPTNVFPEDYDLEAAAEAVQNGATIQEVMPAQIASAKGPNANN